MNSDTLLEICKRYGLGMPQKEPEKVTGGLLHKIWKLTTDKRTYAIKELNPTITTRPGVLENLELSETIARHLKNHGVPAAIGLNSTGAAVQNISGMHFILYEWVDGYVLPNSAAPPDQAFLIGKIIGGIHTANLQIPAVLNGLPGAFTDEHWKSLTASFEEKCSTSVDTKLGLEIIFSCNESASEIIATLTSHLVISHGDIDQKNVLWKDAMHPVIIDWESASRTNPDLEIVDAALNWGGLGAGEVKEDSVKAVINGYRDSGRILQTKPETIVQAIMIKWLPWLEFNMQRVIKLPPGSEEQELALTQVTGTLKNLKLLSTQTHNLVNILN